MRVIALAGIAAQMAAKKDSNSDEEDPLSISYKKVGSSDEEVKEKENPDIAAADALEEWMLNQRANLGQRISTIDAQTCIDKGDTILRIGPFKCYRDTPDDVLRRLSNNPVVRIINPRPHLVVGEDEEEIPSMQNVPPRNLIQTLIHNSWGRQRVDLDASKSLDEQHVQTKPGETFLMIRDGREVISIFQNVPENVLNKLERNEAVLLLRIPAK
jgi:hypothetical protein